MKKQSLLAITLLLLTVIGITACKEKKEKPVEEEVKDEETTSGLPFSFVVEETDHDFAPALQSFAWARTGGSLLLIGGRTNGFHTFDDYNSTFPPKRSNTHIYVVDLDSSKTDSMEIPQKYFYQLRTTNMEYHQDGNTLYCIGGYGSTCEENGKESCYKTYANLTAIDIDAAVKAVKSHDKTALENSIKMAPEDDRLRVTGGELRKIGDWFYLVFGQNFNTMYTDNVTGIYTQQVRRFQIDNSGTTPTISGYAADSCNWDDSSFHRRDLVVVETHDLDGNPNITVYGGVFTPQANLDYQTPIYISQTDASTGATKITTDNNFLQKFNQYAAPTFVLYNPVTKENYTVIFGGITQYYYTDGNLVNGGFNMPFSNYITTIVRKGDGTSVEYPQETQTLPGYIGAEAIFIPGVNYFTGPATSPTLDLSKLGDEKGVTIPIGYIYGGILSAATQSSGTNPTVANNKIYKVSIKR